MDPRLKHPLNVTRRHFLGRAGVGIGVAALAELLQSDLLAQTPARSAIGALPGLPHFAPKAKRVIYLFQGGGPSQIDLFDYKPELEKRQGTDLPDSIRAGQRLTAMTSGQTSFPVARSIFPFAATRDLGRMGQRVDAPHREGRGRPVLHQVAAHRANQSRSGGDVRPDRLSDRGPAQPGSVGDLRAGDDEPGPARVCRDDYGQRPIPGGAAVGHRVHSEPVSGDQAAVGGGSGAVRLGPGGLRQVAAGALHQGSGETEPDRIRGGEQSRDHHANRAV